MAKKSASAPKSKSKAKPKTKVPDPPKQAPRKSGRRGLTLASSQPTQEKLRESDVTEVQRDSVERNFIEDVEEVVDDIPEVSEETPEPSEQNEQPELLEVKNVQKPVVANDRFEVLYMKATCSPAQKSGDPLITLKVSTSLTEAHKSKGLLPETVIAAWKWVAKNHRKNTGFEVPAQTVSFYSVPDTDEDLLHLSSASITGASVSVVQKKGDGATTKVIRFQFNIQIPISREVGKFAENYVGKRLWLNMQTSQEELFDQKEDE